MRKGERPSWPHGGIYSDEYTPDISRQNEHHSSGRQAAARPSFNRDRNRSLEPFPTFPISYPESSQRTRIRDSQFSSSHESFMPAQNNPRLDNNDAYSGTEYSSVPIPSDRPPPRAPAHSFSDRYLDQSSTSDEQAQSPLFLNPPLDSYRELTSSYSGRSDDKRVQVPRRHHPSNFIPIVEQSPANFRAAPPRSFDASEQRSFHSSSSRSASSLSPPPPIERLSGQSMARPRKPSPVKKHICPVCSKEFPRPSGLKTHMNIHNNLRPFKCDFPGCPKTFSVLSNMRRHSRIHTGNVSPPSTAPSEEFEVNFEQPDVPPDQPPPPPSSLSHAPFRVRWVPNNLYSRTAVGARAQPFDAGLNMGAAYQSSEGQTYESMGSYDNEPPPDDTDETYYDEHSWDTRADTHYPGTDD